MIWNDVTYKPYKQNEVVRQILSIKTPFSWLKGMEQNNFIGLVTYEDCGAGGSAGGRFKGVVATDGYSWKLVGLSTTKKVVKAATAANIIRTVHGLKGM